MKKTRSSGFIAFFLTLIALFMGTGICHAATPKVAAGSLYTVSLNSDGTLWAWGDNKYGQLGDGTVVDRWSPVQIGTDTDWSQIALSSGAWHTIALKSDGALWAWGYNSYG